VTNPTAQAPRQRTTSFAAEDRGLFSGPSPARSIIRTSPVDAPP
jgi:hypothetical protein